MRWMRYKAHVWALLGTSLNGCGAQIEVRPPDNAAQQVNGRPIAMPMMSAKIIDGTLDTHTYPAVGMLLTYTFSGELGGSCSGTLIAPDVVLTAKHCVPGHDGQSGYENTDESEGHAPSDLVFVLGAKPLPLATADVYSVRHAIYPLARNPRQNSRFLYPPLFFRSPITSDERQLLERVEQICGSNVVKLHERERLRCIASLPDHVLQELGVRDEHLDTHDIALLFLSRPVTSVEPMRLFFGEMEDVQRRTMYIGPTQPDAIKSVGYGVHKRPPQPFIPLQALRRRSGRAWLSCIGEHMFQLDQLEATCFGDSGGPVVFESGKDMFIIGIASTADARPENLCRQGALFMRTDTYANWIDAAMQRGCETGERLPASCGR